MHVRDAAGESNSSKNVPRTAPFTTESEDGRKRLRSRQTAWHNNGLELHPRELHQREGLRRVRDPSLEPHTQTFKTLDRSVAVRHVRTWQPRHNAAAATDRLAWVHTWGGVAPRMPTEVKSRPRSAPEGSVNRALARSVGPSQGSEADRKRGHMRAERLRLGERLR